MTCKKYQHYWADVTFNSHLQICSKLDYSVYLAALLVAAFWGVQIAMPLPKLRDAGCGPYTALAVSTTATAFVWTIVTRWALHHLGTPALNCVNLAAVVV